MTKLVDNMEKMQDFIEYYNNNRRQIETLINARNDYAARLLDAFAASGSHLNWGVMHKSAAYYRALQVNPGFDFKVTGVFQSDPNASHPFIIVLEVFGTLLKKKDEWRAHDFLNQFELIKSTWTGPGYAHIAAIGYDLHDLGDKDLVTYFEEILDKTWATACQYLVDHVLPSS